MKHILIQNDCDCYGCKGCLNICPKKAIKMEKNKEGFLYPIVDENKCINCGLCLKVCPILNNIKNKDKLKEPSCYAAKIKNKKIQRNSSSGGIFSAIANYVLDQNGIVYGSTLDKNHQVYHIGIENKNELKKIMGSKYVYSDLNDIFLSVRKNLKDNKLVLFSGVPCQIAALKLFLQKDYDNLITVEVICHGTPNQELFEKYIEYLENKYKFKIINYEFRSKKYVNWGNMCVNIVAKHKNEIINKPIESSIDWYYYSFLRSKNYRETCYTCQFARKQRIADFTLGDFWGIRDVSKEFNDPNGVSAVMLNTKKAKAIFNEIDNNINYMTVSFEDISNKNEQLKNPSRRPKERDNWYDGINDKNYIKKRYKKFIYKRFFIAKVKRYIKKILKRL